MEGCPNDDVIVLYTVLSGLVGAVMFLLYEAIRVGLNASRSKAASKHHDRLKDDEFVDLQIELYGEQVLLKDSLARSSHSRRGRSRTNSDGSVTKMASSPTTTGSGPASAKDIPFAVAYTDEEDFAEVAV
jgi:hypothetical protein